jgi:hypothetical protein
MANLKHIGKFGEKPCIVLYREVPGEPENCLIVETQALPDEKHDELIRVVQGTEAQAANELSEVLKRSNFGDSSIMLDHLHFSKNIKKVSVDMVSLTPVPGQSVPLTLVNEELRKISGGHVPPITDETHLQTGPTTETDPNLNAARIDAVNDGTVDQPTQQQVADGLKAQAQMMLDDADLMRTEAEAKIAEAERMVASTTAS